MNVWPPAACVVKPKSCLDITIRYASYLNHVMVLNCKATRSDEDKSSYGNFNPNRFFINFFFLLPGLYLFHEEIWLEEMIAILYFTTLLPHKIFFQSTWNGELYRLFLEHNFCCLCSNQPKLAYSQNLATLLYSVTSRFLVRRSHFPSLA